MRMWCGVLWAFMQVMWVHWRSIVTIVRPRTVYFFSQTTLIGFSAHTARPLGLLTIELQLLSLSHVLPAFVYLSVCLSVCLFAALRENHWTDRFMKILAEMYLWIRKKFYYIYIFWKSSAYESGSGIFWRILQRCEMKSIFHNLVYISIW